MRGPHRRPSVHVSRHRVGGRPRPRVRPAVEYARPVAESSIASVPEVSSDWDPAPHTPRTLDLGRLTPAARMMLVRAHHEAHRAGHQHVDTRHVLAGALGAHDDPVAVALRAAGTSLGGVRAMMAKDVSCAHGGTQSMAAELSAVLSLATRAATTVASRDVCLTFLSGETAATRMLNALGVDPACVTENLLNIEPVASAIDQDEPGLGERIAVALESAEVSATYLGREADEGDVIVYLMTRPSSVVAQALRRLNIQPHQLEESLADARSESRSDDP